MVATENKVIGLIPAGGSASRIAPLPCSKEIFPVGFRTIQNGQEIRSKAVCHFLIEKMNNAGIKKIFIVIRKDKSDIPAYLGDGSEFGVHLAYLIMGAPFGAPYTLDQAYEFVKESTIAFGFADIIFQPDDAYERLIKHQSTSNADVVLGVFPATDPSIMDMVDIDGNGRVRSIEIKPVNTSLQYTWFIAVWSPAFTHFMHDYLIEHEQRLHSGASEEKKDEIFVGDIIQAAIDHGLLIESVLFTDTDYIDIGIPENLIKAVRNNSQSGGA